MQAGDYSCDVSPFCGRAADVLDELRLPTDLPWRWAHLGPITVDGIPLVEHRDGRTCATAQGLDAGPALGRFGGYRLDVLGMTSPPTTLSATPHTLLKLWYVYAVAWRAADGPRVEWRAQGFGPGMFAIRMPDDQETPDSAAIVGRCRDLLQGRFVRRGRPPTDEETAWKNYDLAVKAEQIKAEAPDLPYREIASRLGVSERALRSYRVIAERWHHSQERRRIS